MIHYSLRCADGHEFDGWFRSIATFDQQASDGLLTCPVCGSTAVSRAVMAPSLARGLPAPATDTPSPPAAASEPQPAAPPPAPLPPSPEMVAMRETLHAVRRFVEERCDYVGNAFAEEARRIHYGETPARGIYGEADETAVADLRDEGISIGRIPWLRNDA